MKRRAGLFPLDLTDEQSALERSFEEFVERDVLPISDLIEREDAMPPAIMQRMAELGYWGAAAPAALGGMGLDSLSFGLLGRALGRANASILSLLVVHSMVCAALARWGSKEQQARWLPKLASGELRASLALTEPQGGSDAGNLQLKIEKAADRYRIHGVKTWISGAQQSDIAIVVGACEEKPTAFIVDLRASGVSRRPIQSLLGFRGAMLAELEFDGYEAAAEDMVGRSGFGFSIVAGYALDLGRLLVSWGGAGLAEACLKLSLERVKQRRSFGVPLAEHPLIQGMLAEMIADVTTSLLVSYHAALARDRKGAAADETAMSKYVTSTAARRVSDNALQIFGALGCAAESPIQRYWRDAKIMEIIEGTTQIQQILIGRHASRYY